MDSFVRKPRNSGITQGFATNRCEAIARTKTVGGHIGFIAKQASRGRSQVVCGPFLNPYDHT